MQAFSCILQKKEGITVLIKIKCMLMSQNFTLGRSVCKINKTAYDKVLFFPTVIELFYWIKHDTALKRLQLKKKIATTQPQAIYNDNAVKIQGQESNMVARCNTSGVHYLEKPFNSVVSRAFFLG